ncbi:NAD(+) kinase [Candidatus Peregrinibacteria bacterium CG10_big_fil_rev_8_21_14_0_10_55_24]|nr:MAG: NAD(+) kinase [Candidatus Peregrinibacteria bacterium CG10_big_fil_rev_8_21_14_0_10_55_24]
MGKLVYSRIGLTVKSGLSHKDEAVERVLNILKVLGARVCVDAQRMTDVPMAKHLERLEGYRSIDLLVVIGGDGTILRAVRDLEDFSIPILSVNWGTVGFLSELNLSEVEHLIPSLLTGEGVLEERGVLHVVAKRGKEVLISGYALNEAVLAQGTIARLVSLKTCINGEDLATFTADGLILSTPTGSTAYSLAAGGPVVYPTLKAMILTPINPYSFSQKPIVIPGEAVVDVEVLTKENKFRDTEVVLTLDGQVYLPLQRGDHVAVHVNSKTVKFLRRKQDTFFHTLRDKLKWGESAEN